jgi:hypothetical protein
MKRTARFVFRKALSILLFSILTACLSMIPNGFHRLGEEERTYIKSFNTTVKNSCFHSKKAYFLSKLHYLSYEFIVEGKWEESFSKLKLRIQDPYGNDYFHITKSQENTSFRDLRESVSDDDSKVASLKSLFKELEPKFFRVFFCGDFIRDDNLSSYYFKKNSVSRTSFQIFYLKTVKDFSGFSLKISNELSISSSKKASLVVKSHAVCGSWFKACEFDIEWEGKTKNERLIPSLIRVNYNDILVRFKLLDFE